MTRVHGQLTPWIHTTGSESPRDMLLSYIPVIHMYLWSVQLHVVGGLSCGQNNKAFPCEINKMRQKLQPSLRYLMVAPLALTAKESFIGPTLGPLRKHKCQGPVRLWGGVLNPGQLDTGQLGTGHLDTGQLGTGQSGTHESGKVGQLDTSI